MQLGNITIHTAIVCKCDTELERVHRNIQDHIAVGAEWKEENGNPHPEPQSHCLVKLRKKHKNHNIKTCS